MIAGRWFGAGIAAALALTLAACSSSSTDAQTTPPPSTSNAPTTNAPSTPPVSTSATPPPSSATTTAPSTSASSTAAPPAVFTTTCRSLSVRVLKGGAIRGAEIAAMQFVNDGTAVCTITGTPTATLLRNGAAVGTRSQPNGAAVRPYSLQPGDYAESQLRDFSGCNAPLSDNLRLRLPSLAGAQGRTVTEPITLRACTLEASPVGEPA